MTKINETTTSWTTNALTILIDKHGIERIRKALGTTARTVFHWKQGGKMNTSNLTLLLEMYMLSRTGGLSNAKLEEIRSRHASKPDDINRSFPW